MYGEYYTVVRTTTCSTTDLSEVDVARPVSVGLLDTSGSGGRFASSLGGELLARGLPSSRFTGGLLGTSHVDVALNRNSRAMPYHRCLRSYIPGRSAGIAPFTV